VSLPQENGRLGELFVRQQGWNRGIAMTLTLAELRRVVAELNDTVAGGRVQRIHQPGEKTVVVQVRVPGQTHDVYLCTEHGLARVHLAASPPPNPPEPAQFCKVLRKHLVGGIVRSVEILSNDRVMRFNVERRMADDTHEKTAPPEQPGRLLRFGLVVEIIPGFENIILLEESDAQGPLIIESLQHAVSKDGREIGPHVRYSSPPPGAAVPAGAEDRFDEPMRQQGLARYSDAIEQAYAAKDEGGRRENLRRMLSAALSRTLKRDQRRLAKIEEDFAASSQSDLLQLKGELLKANLDVLQKGQRKVDLPNTLQEPGTAGPEGGTVAVELDPTLSPLENMQRYFKRARKLRKGREFIEGRLEETREAVAGLQRLRERIDKAETYAELEGLADEVPARSAAGKRGPDQEVRSRPREFVSADGLTILVGRSPAQNDEITLHASGNDWWLHVQQYPGAHVIIKSEKDRPLLKETLIDAAHLALHFSKLRDAAKALIDYTQRKYIRKPRGFGPGRVIYSQQKTMMLVPDKRRLQRLLGGHGDLRERQETPRHGRGGD